MLQYRSHLCWEGVVLLRFVSIPFVTPSSTRRKVYKVEWLIQSAWRIFPFPRVSFEGHAISAFGLPFELGNIARCQGCTDEERDADSKELSPLWARILHLEAEVKALCAPASDLADAVHDRERCKALLQSSAALVPGSELLMPTLYKVLQVVELPLAMALVLCWKTSNLLLLLKTF